MGSSIITCDRTVRPEMDARSRTGLLFFFPDVNEGKRLALVGISSTLTST